MPNQRGTARPRQRNAMRATQPRGVSSRIPREPPKLTLTRTERLTLRWQSTDTATDVLPGDLFDTTFLLSMLCMAVTTTTSSSLLQCIKLKKVTAWGNGPITLQWQAPSSGNIGMPITISSDVTLQQADTSRTILIPRPGESAGTWQNWAETGTSHTTGASFYVCVQANPQATIPPYAYIDIDFQYKRSCTGTMNPGPSPTTTVLVPGTVYQPDYIDSLGATKYAAVGLRPYI